MGSISSDGEKLGESSRRGRGHIWEVVLHSVLSWTEPGWRGSSDCPLMGSILVVLAMAGVAAAVGTWSPAQRHSPWGCQWFRAQGLSLGCSKPQKEVS